MSMVRWHKREKPEMDSQMARFGLLMKARNEQWLQCCLTQHDPERLVVRRYHPTQSVTLYGKKWEHTKIHGQCWIAWPSGQGSGSRKLGSLEGQRRTMRIKVKPCRWSGHIVWRPLFHMLMPTEDIHHRRGTNKTTYHPVIDRPLSLVTPLLAWWTYEWDCHGSRDGKFMWMQQHGARLTRLI